MRETCDAREKSLYDGILTWDWIWIGESPCQKSEWRRSKSPHLNFCSKTKLLTCLKSKVYYCLLELLATESGLIISSTRNNSLIRLARSSSWQLRTQITVRWRFSLVRLDKRCRNFKKRNLVTFAVDIQNRLWNTKRTLIFNAVFKPSSCCGLTRKIGRTTWIWAF